MRTEPSFSEESESHLGHADDSSLLSDYRQRYGLSADPFVDDPHFPFYQGAQRRQILEQLLHLCQFSQNLIVVAGDYGVGKTRMAQALIDALDDADDISFVEGQITSNVDSILADVCAQFELSSPEDFAEFCRKKSEQDGLVVLIIDNAHHLSDEVITDLLGLLQDNPESRLHLVLFSEPYLLDRLEAINAPEITLTDFLLDKFSLAEAVDYLNFRMEMADYLGPELFTEAKVEPWWRQSQGQLLLLHEKAQEKLLASVSTPARSRGYAPVKSGVPIPHVVGASALVGVLLFGYIYFDGDSSKKVDTKVTSSVPVAAQASSTVNSQPVISTAATSSIGVVAASSIATEDYKSSAAIQSAAVSSVANPGDSTRSQAAVKQQVVPLAQTSELQNEIPKPKPNVSSSVKDIPKAQVSSEPTKAAAKQKSEASVAQDIKTAQLLSDQEKTILDWNASEYTLQLMGLSNEKAARDFLSAQPNKKDLLLFRSKRAGKDWFVVVTGHYASSAKARQAMQDLPESQKKASPWPREIKIIQQEIRQR